MLHIVDCAIRGYRQCALNYKISPPFVHPSLPTIVAAESSELSQLIFEAGFGKYIIVTGEELLRVTEGIVAVGLVNAEPTAMPFVEM